MDRKLQRHRADSLRQHGFLVQESVDAAAVWSIGEVRPCRCTV